METKETENFKHETLKELYYHEIEQKDKINARLSIPIGVLTLMGSGAVFFISNLKNLNEGCARKIFLGLLILYIAGIFVAVYHAIRAFVGHRYKYLPKPTEISTQFQVYLDYYDENYKDFFSDTGSTKDELIQSDVKKEFCDLYKDATDNNIDKNYDKISHIRKMSNIMIFVMVVGALSLAPYYYAVNNKNEELKEIQIYINGEEVNGLAENENKNSNEKTSTKVPPKKPEPMKLRTLNESFGLEEEKEEE